MITPPTSIDQVVERAIEHDSSTLEGLEDVDASTGDDVLFIELQIEEEATVTLFENAIKIGTMAYYGGVVPFIQQGGASVDRAVIDLVEGSSEIRFRTELPNEWVRKQLTGEISEKELLLRPLSELYAIDEEGASRSLEDLFQEILEKEADGNIEDADLSEAAEEMAFTDGSDDNE